MAITFPDTQRVVTCPPEVKIVDDRAQRFSDVVVHRFRLGDVEDVDIYAADPIYKWQQTEAGQWATEHTVAPLYYMSQLDYNSIRTQVAVFARFSDRDYTFWKLKWEQAT